MADGPIFITHLCVLVVFFTSLFDVAASLDLSCVEVKKEYVKMGFRDDHNVPMSVIAGDHLQICPQGSTCCTADMESKLKSVSMKEYENLEGNAFKLIRSTFVSRTKKFDEFFTELLENSKKDLHKMFVRTYGLLYQQNAEVFSDLFRDLKLYYKGSNLNLVDILNKFFTSLLKRMFELLNAQYLFDSDYMACVTSHMDNLKPFGDVPQKLKLQVKRAFIASRTFVQGLAIGRDVILAMERVKPTEACSRGMTRMTYCPYCQGLTRTKPCNKYCLNTMKGCLAHHSELNKAWNEYIEALKMVAQRLEGPFNIETVVDPMNVKISEAIMNFQEDSPTVSDKIFKGCGTPRRAPVRYKRQDSSSYDEYKYGKDFNKFSSGGNSREARPTTAAGTNLDKLVRDIKDKIEEAKNFWVQLPYTICNSDIAAQPGEDDDCWNGVDRARYVHEVQKDGRMYQVNNPEVTVDVQEDNGIISVQIYNLKLITTKLHNAYHGVDVEWSATDTDIEIDASGAGDLESSGDRGTGGNIEASGDDMDTYSGSGSGYGPGGYDDDEDLPGRGQPHYPTRHPSGHNPGRRPTGTERPPDGGIDFTDPSNPIYNVNNKKENTGADSGSARCLGSSNVLVMVVSVVCVVLRVVL